MSNKLYLTRRQRDMFRGLAKKANSMHFDEKNLFTSKLPDDVQNPLPWINIWYNQ